MRTVSGDELKELDVANGVGSVGRSRPQVGNGEDAGTIVGAVVGDEIVVVGDRIIGEVAAENHGIAAGGEKAAVGELAAGRVDIAVAAAIDDIITAAGEDPIVAKGAVQGIGVELAVDQVVAVVALVFVGRALGRAAPPRPPPPPAAGSPISVTHGPLASMSAPLAWVRVS